MVRWAMTGSKRVEITRKHVVYWSFVALIVGGGWFTSHRLTRVLEPVRYRIDSFLRGFSPFQSDPVYTVLVVIGDREFADGKLTRQTPFDRQYLATLIEEVAKLNPAVIGVDFILDSPDQNGATRTEIALPAEEGGKISLPVEPGHLDKTVALCKSVSKVAKTAAGPRIVLAESLCPDEDAYDRVSAVYDGFPWGADAGRVRSGFVNLDEEDLRCVTPVQSVRNLKQGQTCDSFSAAVVSCIAPTRYRSFIRDSDYFAGLFGPDSSHEQFPTVTAGEVLLAAKTDDHAALARLRDTCAHKVVIIGGDYHLSALDQPDIHTTPVGDYRGIDLHANYIESLLAGRALPISKSMIAVIEVCLSLILAWIIISESLSPGWWVFWIVFMLLMPFILSYLALFNLGLYLDLSGVVVFLLLDIWLHRHEIVARAKTAWRKYLGKTPAAAGE